jgi:threonine dehydrogenase-like Zn-dependent dehydrogenase
MLAALATGTGHFELTEVARPEPGSGELRVRLEACGICGSDLHFARMGAHRAGFTPGHEMLGWVDALGEGEHKVVPGDRVVIEPLSSFGDCAACRTGRDSACRDLQIYGVHIPGGFSEYVVIPADRAYPVADDLPAAIAAMAEPLAVGVHGLRRPPGGLPQGGRVLILGAGAVGLTTLIAARALGAGEVWISARHPQQIEAAAALGAHTVLQEADATPDALDQIGRAQDFDLVLETVGGTADTLLAACAAARPGGDISILGVFTASPQLPPFAVLSKELSLHWSNCYHRACAQTGEPADFSTATQLVSQERDALALLTTHALPLAELDAAFALAGDKQQGSIKVTSLIA